MAFIAIDAKADVQGSKKGKLTPTQHAQLNAWCLASKTGIFDCLNKCEATSSSYTASNNIATVVFKSGYIVICGRLVECEEGTEVLVQTPVSGEINGRIILRYSLSNTGEDEFVVTTKNETLTQNDLNENPITGVYEFELYSYKATPTSITLTRNVEYVPDVSGKINELKESLKKGDVTVMNAHYAQHAWYASDDLSKGTIEERLTKLGFSQGSIVSLSTDLTNATLNRVGTYAILKLPAIQIGSGTVTSTGTMSFTAKEKVVFSIGGGARGVTDGYVGDGGCGSGTIEGNKITLKLQGSSYGMKYNPTQIGFEVVI